MNGLGQKRSPETKWAEFERKYGSVDRVLWVQRQPSVISGGTPCVNAHMAHEGMGMKGHYTTIVPLTVAEHNEIEAINGGIETFCQRHGVTVEQLLDHAAEIERRWQALPEYAW